MEKIRREGQNDLLHICNVNLKTGSRSLPCSEPFPIFRDLNGKSQFVAPVERMNNE